MTTERIAKKWLSKMNSLMAKFFWEKLDKVRYMSFIAWEKICRPYNMEGLGVRSLENFGDALLLKIPWGLLSDEDKLWVNACKAKYYPQLGFWRAKVGARASSMWRQAHNMRTFFQEDVMWQVTNGMKIYAKTGR
ncbi:RNA-directed DNA polymerase (reverse transcriptase)-related family protein [Rhynchospora pubera]|uniref:RNA-directed DNA polymerase (Reverse transcriptase)-related family protein n=1 Tax=Rhynchospora pubera TaxID=906938 RepID=A0AAV8ENC5_9POAL|nr:RNA-directed DNA polymerase (reverse transcriptase)-related family protein [Rhynchospora pubera]